MIGIVAMTAACAPLTPQGPSAVALPRPTRVCTATAATALVAQRYDTPLGERARVATGSARVRVLRPNDAATMDFRPDRLNIDLDANGVVSGFRCG